MTVGTTNYFTDWLAANGSNKNWAYGFPIPGEDSVVVMVRDVSNPTAITEYRTNFTLVPVDDDNGTVVYPASGAALAAGKEVRIVREVPYTQLTQIGTEGAFNPKIHEDALDKLTMLVQQLYGTTTRSLRFPLGGNVTELPTDRAGHTLAFDSSGNPINGPTSGDIANAATNAAAATASAEAAAASAAAAALLDLTSYSTTDQVETMLGGYVPAGRRLIAGTGVKLNGGAEASLAGDVTITVAGVPTGAVMGFDLSAPPAGWIAGDGSAINRHVYADLDAAKYCGDALNATATAWYRCSDPASPGSTRSIAGDYLVTRDLRGVFTRFLDGGRGIDAGRELGSRQVDMVGPHTHALSSAIGQSTRKLSGGSNNNVDLEYGAAITILANSGTETRPINIALLGCIKY